jgi:tetratricopeptide (TPR) repeat protein
MSESTSSEDRLNHLTTMLIVTVALLAATVALLQQDAATRGDRLRRDSQRFAIQAMRQRSVGEMRVGYDWNSAYQTWLELDLLAESAEQDNHTAAARRYRTMRDEIATLSPLLAAPYFDTATGAAPHVFGYEADTYLVEATALSERALAFFAVGDAWDSKADASITHLSLFAVALALFGLAATLSGRVRWIFVSTGTLIATITLAWVVQVYTRPSPVIVEPAIDAYARGVGLAYRGETEKAIAAFDQALASKSDYANAYYARGNARYALNDYPTAVADFEAARAAGRDDTSVAWDLGWTYYLMGRYDDAVRANRRAIQLDEDLIGVRLNLGLTYLAAGKIEEAQKEYADAATQAARLVAAAKATGQEPPTSLWFGLDAGALDLENLLDRLNDRSYPWTEAPPRQAIANTSAVQTVARGLIGELKSLNTALEYTDKPPTQPLAARISALKFAAPKDAETEELAIAESFPEGTKEVAVLFDYAGMQDGQDIVLKVYVNGEEDGALRLEDQWNMGQSGQAEYRVGLTYSKLFTLSPGEYQVDLFVSWRLAQSGRFTVQKGK